MVIYLSILPFEFEVEIVLLFLAAFWSRCVLDNLLFMVPWIEFEYAFLWKRLSLSAWFHSWNLVLVV